MSADPRVDPAPSRSSLEAGFGTDSGASLGIHPGQRPAHEKDRNDEVIRPPRSRFVGIPSTNIWVWGEIFDRVRQITGV
jgi:hypothetical protein